MTGQPRLIRILQAHHDDIGFRVVRSKERANGRKTSPTISIPGWHSMTSLITSRLSRERSAKKIHSHVIVKVHSSTSPDNSSRIQIQIYLDKKEDLHFIDPILNGLRKYQYQMVHTRKDEQVLQLVGMSVIN
jgi:hypothetical protein